MNHKAEQKLVDITQNLLANNMFFGAAVLEFDKAPKNEEGVTVQCDGETLFYNEEWVNSQGTDTIKCEIARMILGCSLKHHTRRGERDPNLWQQAHLDTTQPLLVDADLTDEHGGVDMSIEDRYDELKENQPDTPPDSNNSDNNKEEDKDNKEDKEDKPNPNKSQAPNQVENENKGEIQDTPKTDPDPTNGPLSQKDQDEEERRWDDIVNRSLQFAKAAGKGPGAIQDIITASHKPTMSLENILRRFMTEKTKEDYTWSRPNLRYISQGIYLPAIENEQLPPLFFALDTSSSMSKHHVDLIWSMVRKTVLDTRIEELWVIQCDDGIQRVDKYNKTRLPATLDYSGGGGTNFYPVFDWIKENKHKPTVLIYLTDLEAGIGYKPPYPILWCSTSYDLDKKAPFGTTINILSKEEKRHAL